MKIDPRHTQLLMVAIQHVPAIVAWVKATFKKDNPDAELPTDDEVVAALRDAIASSVAKDDAWLAAHPEE